MKDDLYCHDMPDEWDGWEDATTSPNEVCPECKSHNIKMQQALIFAQTLLEPAEYDFKGWCKDCDAEFDYPDEIEQECSCRPETQYGLSGEACDYCKSQNSDEIPY